MLQLCPCIWLRFHLSTLVIGSLDLHEQLMTSGNIGTFYMHELFWMLQWTSIYCLNGLCENGYCCTLMKTRTAAHNCSSYYWFTLLIFPWDIWCKINKLLKYYEYQLTKRCLEEGSKVQGFFMRLVKDRIA